MIEAPHLRGREEPFAIKVLAELVISSLQAAVDSMGSEQAVEALRKYYHHNGLWAAAFYRNKWPTVSDLDSLFLASGAVGEYAVLGMEYRSAGDGLSGVAYCPFQSSLPEFCLLHNVMIQGVLDGLRIGRKHSITHPMTHGGDFCEYRLDPPIIDPEKSDFGRKAYEELTPEEIVFWRKAGFGEYWVMNTRGILDTLAKERGMELAIRYAEKLGMVHGPELVRSIQKADPIQMAVHAIELVNQQLDQTGTMDVHTDHATRTISDCPFKDSPHEICQQFEAFCQGVCHSIHPELSFQYQSKMTNGAANCSWSIMRTGGKKTTSPTAPTIPKEDEAMRALRLRLAKGEISKEEYQELRILLEDE